MYGRTGELLRLNKDRNDYTLSRIVRSRANEAYVKIANQIKDKKLMSLRLRLIRATQAGNMKISEKIQMQMRDYLKEDRDTGQ
jgi:hypothetical protein